MAARSPFALAKKPYLEGDYAPTEVVLMRFFAAVLLMSVVVFPSSATASPILDQSYDDRTNAIFIVGAANYELAQTFTVGITGGLVSVDLPITRSDGLLPFLSDLQLDILPTVSGVPVSDAGQALSSVVISKSLLPQMPFFGSGEFLHIVIPAIPVAAGDVLAIALRGTIPDRFDQFEWWGSRGAGGYDSGAAFRRFGADWQLEASGDSLPRDRAFRTYVEPASVPEPGFMLALVTGIVALGVRRRQRS